MRENREQLKDKARPKRVPVYEANRNKITVNGLDNENFQYRWVNDVESRLQLFLDGGWEFCDKHGKSVGDGGIEASNGTGSALSKGMGGGVTAFLMRIPKEIWLEDQQRKEREDVAPLEAEMKKRARETSDYGQMTLDTNARKA